MIPFVGEKAISTRYVSVCKLIEMPLAGYLALWRGQPRRTSALFCTLEPLPWEHICVFFVKLCFALFFFFKSTLKNKALRKQWGWVGRALPSGSEGKSQKRWHQNWIFKEASPEEKRLLKAAQLEKKRMYLRQDRNSNRVLACVAGRGEEGRVRSEMGLCRWV